MAIALAACGSAGADPASGIAAPAGWQASRPIADAVRAAAGDGASGAEAWAEPAMGCYGVWLALHGSVDAQQMLDSIAAERITVTGVENADGLVTATIEKAPYHGTLRVRLGETSTIVACFDNGRERAACEAGCKGLLGAVR